MSKKLLAWMLVLMMVIGCAGAGAEEAGQLRGLIEAGETLLTRTDNVTMEGYAEFSLDGGGSLQEG